MRYIDNIIEWFTSLSTTFKIVIVLVGVLVALLASRVVSGVAALVVVIGVIALIVRAIRRRPLRQWGLLTIGALVVAVVFGSVANALYGPTETQRESAVSPAPAEEAKQEQPEPPPPAPPPPAPPPAPASEEKAEAEPQRAEKEKKDQPEESTAEIGQSVEVDEAAWLVTDARRAQQLDDQFGGILPPKQGDFVVVDFRFKNNSNETKTLHSGALKLIDRDGRESEPDTDTFSYIPQDKNILLEQVNPGVTKDAQVIFSVAPDASDFKLRLRGTNLFSLAEPKEVALGF